MILVEMSQQPRKAAMRRSPLYIKHCLHDEGVAKTEVSGIAGSFSLARWIYTLSVHKRRRIFAMIEVQQKSEMTGIVYLFSSNILPNTLQAARGVRSAQQAHLQPR